MSSLWSCFLCILSSLLKHRTPPPHSPFDLWKGEGARIVTIKAYKEREFWWNITLLQISRYMNIFNSECQDTVYKIFNLYEKVTEPQQVRYQCMDYELYNLYINPFYLPLLFIVQNFPLKLYPFNKWVLLARQWCNTRLFIIIWPSF